MARRRYILIPPSEAKALGGEGPPWSEAVGAVDHPLFPSRREVIAALDRMLRSGPSPAALRRFFGVKGDALTRALDADRDLDDAATLPAIERYEGVFYQHLDGKHLSPAEMARLGRTVRIVSGLWGVLAPDEPIPDYRLKMSSRLEPLGVLSQWWRPVVTEFVRTESRGAELWNLLPREHAASLGAMSNRVVTTATFLSPDRRGELAAVSHRNKALKGALVAHLVRNPSLHAADLADWEHPGGYTLDPSSIDPVEGTRALRFIAG